MNVSETFGIPYKAFYSTVLPPLKSVWLEKWSVDSIHSRVMDVPQLSNNVIIVTRRKVPSVKPNVIITNITKLIGQAWSIRVRNVMVGLKSANFSVGSNIILHGIYRNKGDDFYNLTDNLTWSNYEKLYENPTPGGKIHTISRLYICDQVELEPSEFLLNSKNSALYIYTSKRVLFDNQFVLIRSSTSSGNRARICIEDSGLYKRTTNMGAIIKTFDICCVEVSMLLIFLLHCLL
jgi:hypothetical protein